MTWVKIYCEDCNEDIMRRSIKVERGESILSSGDAIDSLIEEADVLHSNHTIIVSRE